MTLTADAEARERPRVTNLTVLSRGDSIWAYVASEVAVGEPDLLDRLLRRGSALGHVGWLDGLGLLDNRRVGRHSFLFTATRFAIASVTVICVYSFTRAVAVVWAVPGR